MERLSFISPSHDPTRYRAKQALNDCGWAVGDLANLNERANAARMNAVLSTIKSDDRTGYLHLEDADRVNPGPATDSAMAAYSAANLAIDDRASSSSKDRPKKKRCTRVKKAAAAAAGLPQPEEEDDEETPTEFIQDEETNLAGLGSHCT